MWHEQCLNESICFSIVMYILQLFSLSYFYLLSRTLTILKQKGLCPQKSKHICVLPINFKIFFSYTHSSPSGVAQGSQHLMTSIRIMGPQCYFLLPSLALYNGIICSQSLNLKGTVAWDGAYHAFFILFELIQLWHWKAWKDYSCVHITRKIYRTVAYLHSTVRQFLTERKVVKSDFVV